MRNAGLALRHAKLAGPHRYEFFSPQFKEMALSRLDLSAELRHAVSRDQIEQLYEPRVELASGRVVAGEAVLRWKHASGRVIEGDELMDLAGSSEMDVVLTEWLFEVLMKHMKNWRAAGLQAVPIAVKVSLANVRPSDLVHLVNAAIGNGVDARQLSLELQQVSALDNLPAKEAAAIAGLRKKGVRIALGRFGASASISHLRVLPCDEIMPDASFLRDIERDATAQAMLLGIGDVARRLKLSCVASGVETAQQAAFLKKNGWDQGQGRYFGEAASGLVFAAKWLTRGGRPVRISLPGNLS
jgi:EAL domain-containing protein (putative c-di-GMP-specific phosphodiesterase class I)